jgi:hypothetical protein
MMSTSYKKLGLYALVAFLLASFAFWFGCRLLLDGPAGIFGAIMFPSATFYAEGYSDYRFLRVRTGMKESEVLGLLGEPIAKYPVKASPLKGWSYSRRTKYESYHVRAVLFEDGVVKRVRHSFYAD